MLGGRYCLIATPQGGHTVKNTISIFLLLFSFLGCKSDEPFNTPFEDRSTLIESVLGQTYVGEWIYENCSMVLTIHDTDAHSKNETLPFHFDIGNEGDRCHQRVWGSVDLNKLTQKGRRVHAPLVGEVKFFPYSLQSLHFQREDDGSYTLIQVAVGESTQFLPRPIIHAIDFAESD